MTQSYIVVQNCTNLHLTPSIRFLVTPVKVFLSVAHSREGTEPAEG